MSPDIFLNSRKEQTVSGELLAVSGEDQFSLLEKQSCAERDLIMQIVIIIATDQ